MTPDVAAVRQNLIPLVDHGVVNPTCATGGTARVGLHRRAGGLHQPLRVRGHRDRRRDLRRGPGAVGVHARRDPPLGGGGPRDGARHQPGLGLRAPTSTPTGQPRPDAFQLFPGEQVGAQHYLQTSSRDFVSFDLRSVADTAGAPPSTQHHGGKHRTSGDKHHP